MFILSWCIAGLLIGLSLIGSLAQWNAIFLAIRRMRSDKTASGYSCVPLVIGLLGVIGMLLAPAVLLQQIWWVPLIVDPGSALMCTTGAVYGIGYLVRRFTRPTA
ncbi:hypothetical protein Mal48_35360 [Thalassoglobus polymorphus]|uniref:Uncharacterized protein n=1 Tax=Thalassoglobus polymorphus TaxID=2527994 RepID=A0A517QRM2_9PLAN|nr:hypothetical protein Mal48_35360 [Thalassoglobus polymorphus]